MPWVMIVEFERDDRLLARARLGDLGGKIEEIGGAHRFFSPFAGGRDRPRRIIGNIRRRSTQPTLRGPPDLIQGSLAMTASRYGLRSGGFALVARFNQFEMIW